MSTHLLVLVHGMWGNPNHLAELHRIITETHPELHVLVSKTNSEENTYDGIDLGAERVAQEIYDEVAKLDADGRKVNQFSITGYSLGGLVSRYVIGILRQRSFFDHIAPINFNTFATPHIGLVRYASFFSSMASFLGPKLLSRTGEQFYCVDKWSAKGRPLLEVMADPDRIFYQALASFKSIQIYANALNDMTVPYVTAAIDLHDPFVTMTATGLNVDLDEEFSPLIKSYSTPLEPPVLPSKPVVFSPGWFKSLKAPMLPPFLQFRFPLNLLVYTLLPLLIPTFMTLALLRLSLSARSSRARIRLLDSDEKNVSTRLAAVIADLERQMEDAVIDLIEEPEPVSTKESTTGLKEQPKLLPSQRRMAQQLNQLPIHKYRAFFPTVRNSHAVIISRDVRNFEFHKQGHGIIRHWATTFIL